MKKISASTLMLLMSLLFISCDFIDQQAPVLPSANPDELIQAEKNFSRMSDERGMKQAFLHYIAKEGVLLRPDENPIVGADAIQYLTEVNDDGYHITWHPQKAEIASDGNMGFTYGVYEIVVNADTIKGTYVNVWKKQNGEWKFVINSGNQGIAFD